MTYLITGGKGQLGTELTHLLETKNLSYTSYGSKELNILDREEVEKVLNKDRPAVVFHCAAYTAVDAAEENKELNWQVNVQGTRNVAEVCKELDILFVYI